MEIIETPEEIKRRVDREEMQLMKERAARELAARLAPPPEHFVSAARQIIAAQDEPASEPSPTERAAQIRDATAVSLARMHATLGATPPAASAMPPTPVSASLARMQAATGQRVTAPTPPPAAPAPARPAPVVPPSRPVAPTANTQGASLARMQAATGAKSEPLDPAAVTRMHLVAGAGARPANYLNRTTN